MPIFEYKAVDAENKNCKGIIDADSARDARLKLRREKMFVTDLKERAKRQRRRQRGNVTRPLGGDNDETPCVAGCGKLLRRGVMPVCSRRGFAVCRAIARKGKAEPGRNTQQRACHRPVPEHQQLGLRHHRLDEDVH